MSKFSLLPLRLKDSYGQKKLQVFYPDVYPNAHNITYREVIDLYDECVRRNDADAIELLQKNYDLEEIFEFDEKYHKEKSVNREFTKTETTRDFMRRHYLLTGKSQKRFVGGKYYRDLFHTDGKDGYFFDTRRCFFRMPLSDMQALFDMSCANVKVTVSYKELFNLYSLFETLPDRKELILFYLRYMVNRPFPIWEYQEIRDGVIKLS